MTYEESLTLERGNEVVVREDGQSKLLRVIDTNKVPKEYSYNYQPNVYLLLSNGRWYNHKDVEAKTHQNSYIVDYEEF